MDDLVAIADVAKMFPGLTPGDIYRLEVRGEFPEILRITERKRYVRRADLDRWISARWSGSMRVAQSPVWTSSAAKRLGGAG